jgi:CHAT domain
MKTAYITIEERAKRQTGYPVRLYFADGQPDWTQKKRALASAVMPADLSLVNPPEDPVTGQPLEGAKLQEVFLKQSGGSPRFEAIGEYLYRLLFQGKVKDRWEALRDQFAKEDPGRSEGLRTLLNIAPPALRLLPWELMYDAGSYLFLDPDHPFIRGSVSVSPPCEPCYWPLHILVVIGSADDDVQVEAKRELSDIEDAIIRFGRPVDLEVLKRPTNDELADKLQTFKPHVFHFIGHGMKASKRDAPVLVFESNGTNPRWEWGDQKITRDLRGKWVPRFAFINACRSSDTPKDVARVLGISEAFAAAGVPAVLGMQADVQGSAAARFPAKLYEALSRDIPLDVALAQARIDVSRMVNDGLERRDWALATLSLTVPPEQVLPMRPPVTPVFRNTINARFSDYTDFVDRVEPRRKLWSGIEPQPDAPDTKNLLIIKGAEEVGKTWLVQWALKSCAWRERKIAYVSLKRPLPGETQDQTKDFLQVLHLISGTKHEPDSIRSLSPNAFAEFDQLLAQLAQPQPIAAAVGQPAMLDHSEIENIFGAFKIALQKAAGAQPLVIALDDLKVRKDHFKNYLMPNLFKPVAIGREEALKNIRMILVVTDTVYDDPDFGLSELAGVSLTVPLGLLNKLDLEYFSRELCILRGLPREKADKLISLLADAQAPTFKPGAVRQFINGWLSINQ